MRNFLLFRLIGSKKKNPVIINTSFKTIVPDKQISLEEWIREYSVSRLYSQHKPVIITDGDIDSIKIEAITRAHKLFADSIS